MKKNNLQINQTLGIAYENHKKGNLDLAKSLYEKALKTDSNNFEVKFRKMKEVSLLVLDDMGAQNSSSWAEEKLYQLVNYRHLKKSPTIITTNCKLGDIQPRIASRLADIQISTVYEITAPDYRIGGTKII